jgi:uncharacterized membrane protein YraQ (UPF0718 family)
VAALSDTVQEFGALSLQVLPFLLLGAAVGAALEALVPPRWPARLFGRDSRASLPAAVLAGAALPGCSCATMPMAAGLAAGGRVRTGTVAAFIFASPLLSPITVALTWAMLGLEMTLARTIAAVAGALLLGAALQRLEARLGAARGRPLLPIAGGSPECDAACCAEPRSGPGRARLFAASLRRILRTILPYFALGMAIAAAITTLLPEQAIPSALGGSSALAAYLLAAIVAIPMYVCEGEEVPITYALVGQGLGQGPALTFLLGAVGTCVPTMLMSQRVIGRRATFLYAAFWIPFAIGAGALFALALSA